MYKMRQITSDEKGFTLAELVVVLAIMTILTASVTRIIVGSINVMMMGTRQSVTQSSVEHVINKIAEDIRQAGSNDLKHIRTGSSGRSVQFVRFQQNVDGYSGNGDLNFDHACYSFILPSGSDAYDTNYKPGYIKGGTGSGDPNVPGCRSYPLTDAFADVRSFLVEYCRPGEDNPGDYDCTTNSIDNVGLLVQPPNYPDLTDTAACVWMVKLSATYSRRYIPKGEDINPAYYNNSTYMYQTAVMLRNPFTMALFQDQDKDGYIDCCDKDFRTDIGNDIDWCPPPNG